jgi:dolichyl-phosphate-mannose--protein O-mannosyl transferase
VALAVILVGAWRHGGWQRPAAAVYGVAVVLVFAYFFPMYTAVSLPAEAVAARLWFGSWR